MLIHVVQRTVLYRSGSLISRFDGIVALPPLNFVGVRAFPRSGRPHNFVLLAALDLRPERLAFLRDETLKIIGIQQGETQCWKVARVSRELFSSILE